MNDNALAPFGLSADWINRLRNPENLLKPFEGEREGEREGGRPTGKEEDGASRIVKRALSNGFYEDSKFLLTGLRRGKHGLNFDVW